MTVTFTGMFFTLKAANVKPPMVSLDAVDIMKFAGGIVRGVLVKDYAVCKKWIKEWYNNKILLPLRATKLHRLRGTYLSYFVDLLAQTSLQRSYGLGQSHFSHIFHTDLGQPHALCEVDSPQEFSNTILYYFSIVKIPLGLVTLMWATASSRLNT